MEIINNCKTCLYSNFNEDMSVECDKKQVLTGKLIHIDAEDVEKNCVAHSSNRIEEWRYDRQNKFIDEAEDACSCGRMVNLEDEGSYKVIGSNLYCKICANEITTEDGR